MYTFHTQTTQAYFECRFWTRTLSMNWRQTHFQSIHLLFFSRVQLKNKTCKSKHIFQQNVQNMSRQNDYSCSSDQRWVFCNSVLLSGGRLANSGFGHSGTPSPLFQSLPLPPYPPSFPPPLPPSRSLWAPHLNQLGGLGSRQTIWCIYISAKRSSSSGNSFCAFS